MTREAPKNNVVLKPRERAGLVAFEPYAASKWSGSVGMLAARYLDAPASEIELPPSSHHSLVLVNRPSEEGEVRYADVLRRVPPPAGSILVIPAGTPARWRWNGRNDSLTVSLEPHLVARVAAESFDLDPVRVVVPPLDRLDVPQVRTAMQAIDAELMAGTAWGNLAAESLANVLAVSLIRYVSAPRQRARDRDGKLPQSKLRSIVDYIEDHLDVGLTLGDLATVARLSPYHFARQFRAATGLPPYQFVLARRVDRAKQLLQGGDDSSLAEVAARAGFSDQSQFSRHFKRMVGVTPGQFRTPARFT
jgi:AraC family transcriptional regulator